VFLTRDENGDDAKLLCVTASDPRQAAYQELDDLPGHVLDEIAHFFAIYKSLEPGKGTTPGGWRDRQLAEQAVTESRRRYQDKHGAGNPGSASDERPDAVRDHAPR
jgi:inorganic pyrophosphatase